MKQFTKQFVSASPRGTGFICDALSLRVGIYMHPGSADDSTSGDSYCVMIM